MSNKIWKLKTEIPKDVAEKLSDYPSFISQLLYDRGITQKEHVEAFIDPKYDNLYSPFLFKDMQKAVDRIWQAILNNEKVCIYGDYDADAVTANAVLQQTFRHLGVEVDSYIPDRFTEGYGINLEALSKISARGGSASGGKDNKNGIIITVDCGTNSRDAAQFCIENNIDLIITDHHEVIGELPKAYAIINPKNRSDSYPYEDITGVGVAFKLACGLLSQESKIKDKGLELIPGWEKWLLDLVAIGTVADCHSLIGENRILVKYGLKVLAKTKWPGLRAIINTSGLDFTNKTPDSYTLGFVIAPRLNAAGRLEHANMALHLLMETDAAVALERAQQLEKVNIKRQDQTARIVSEAKDQALNLQDRKVIVLLGEGWSKGVVGLVAGRLAEEYKKPVIVLEKGEAESTGSARTVGEFNVVEALKYASEYLVRFGGHKQAAGLTIKTVDFEKFYLKVLEYAESNLRAEDLEQKLLLDAELAATDLSLVTCNLLQSFEPFGVNNPKPKFLVSNIEIASARQVGQNKQHGQLQLKKEQTVVAAIAFNFNLVEKNLKVGDTIDVAAELMQDNWNNRSVVKLRIIDVRKIN